MSQCAEMGRCRVRADVFTGTRKVEMAKHPRPGFRRFGSPQAAKHQHYSCNRFAKTRPLPLPIAHESQLILCSVSLLLPFVVMPRIPPTQIFLILRSTFMGRLRGAVILNAQLCIQIRKKGEFQG